MAIWASQSIQFVWFLTSVENVKAAGLFERLTGEEPENVQTNRVPSPANPFLGVAAGIIEQKQYTVQVQPGRIDFTIAPPNEMERPDAAVTLLDTEADISAALKRLEGFALDWPEAIRQSIVVNLVQPAPTQAEASEKLYAILDLDLGMDDVTDSVFQLNRRKQLPALGISINRLMRFSIASYQEFLVQVTPNGTAPVPVSRQHFATALTLDFNTVPDGRRLASKDQLPIFQALAAEILRVGEIGSPAALAE